jgi:spore maturation protein SpmB
VIGTLKRGWGVGLKTTWTLGKVIFPITVIVTLLQYSPILHWLIAKAAPLMKWIGLPGEAAIVLVLGNFLNLYAGIGAMFTLDLTVKEVFILAMMLSFSHNLLVESTVAARVGVSVAMTAAVRVGLALLSAFVIHLVWDGGQELAKYGFVPQAADAPDTWGEMILAGVEKATYGVIQLALIIIPLMIAIQFLKELKWLDTFSRWMAPFTKLLGMRENTSLTMAAGLLFGLAYGAGVMIQAVKEDGVAKKDLTLAFIFLVACHAVVEDTLLFVPLGIPVWPLLVIRLVTAILLTTIVSIIWNHFEHRERKEATYEH